ncbi:MAG: 2-polyprenyl-3-methyl-5-hydroxy-6-metoxy-1,4-benzoquinol methylase [Candidatus Midichloriaceae bacterium]|jgi:2-polyprenyl-3-methyl-5-hydroxy-6-metoxy-1,4-benzoquinol methylase
MFLKKKLKNLFSSFISFDFSIFSIDNVKLVINEWKVFFVEARGKLKKLSKTNYELGLYHFEKGNVYDALLRFKLLNYYSPIYKDLDYLIGRCYVEKGKYDKGLKYLEKYLNSGEKDCYEEVMYCIKLATNDLKDIVHLPPGIINHKLSQRFNLYLSDAKESENKKGRNIVYDEIENALKNSKKAFDFDMLHFNCGVGLIPKLLRKTKFLKFVLGIEKNEKMYEHSNDLHLDKIKVYNSVYNQNVSEFLNEDSKKDSNFDIILAENLLRYSSDMEYFFEKIKQYISSDGILIINFNANKDIKKFAFNRKYEEFIYEKGFVRDLVSKYGWNIFNEHSLFMKNHEQITLVLKL